MANEQNLRPGEYKLTLEEQKRGGIASGKARREKRTMRETLEMCLNMENKDGKTYKELVTLGLLKGATKGNSNNYRTILEVLGELNKIEEDKQAQQMAKVEQLLTKIEEEAKK